MNEGYILGVRPDTFPNSGSYISELPVVKNLFALERLELDKRITFFVGENGTGKSTLLEAIALKFGFNPEGGSLNFSFSTADSHSELHKHIKLIRGIERPADSFFLRAESFYNAASYIDRLDELDEIARLIDSYGGVSLHKQSHGESFLSLVENRFRGRGLYILDEPEAALSPSRQMSLLIRINELVKNDSQFIIATHSPILLAFPGAAIYQLTDEEIRRTAYRETEIYSVTRSFIESPERMIKHLFEEQRLEKGE